MAQAKNILDKIRTPEPCSVGWEAMVGDNQARHCNACDKSVYNLSNMTRKEAEALILKSNGKLCARYARRADGSVVTTFDPSDRERPGGSRLRLAAGALTAIISLAPASMAQTGQAGQDQKPARNEAIDKKPAEKPSEVSTTAIWGVVRDSQGGVVAGALITLFSEAGVEIKRFTSNEGGFEVGRLSAGAYKVKVEASGISRFAPDKRIVPVESDQQFAGIEIVLGTDGIVMTEEILGDNSNVVVMGISELRLPAQNPALEILLWLPNKLNSYRSK